MTLEKNKSDSKIVESDNKKCFKIFKKNKKLRVDMFLNRTEIDSEQKYEPDYSILINLESENFLHLVKHAS